MQAEPNINELMMQLDEKSRLLDESRDRIRELERASAISREQQAIMLALHDEIGGYLISALSVAELEQGDSSEMHRILSTAMRELRMVIDALSSDKDDLITVLAMFRRYIEPVLKHQGVNLHWLIDAEPALDASHQPLALHFIRMIQILIRELLRFTDSKNLSINIGSRLIRVHADEKGEVNRLIRGRALDAIRSRGEQINVKVVVDTAGDTGGDRSDDRGNEGVSISICW